MKRLLLVLSLQLVASVAWAGITDRYVTDAGAGTGTGNDAANPMSYATFVDYMSAGGSFTAAAGDRFNIKGAITARTTTADTWVNGGTATSPVIIRGYNSTIGDLTSVARTNGNGALVTTNYPTISYTTGATIVTGSFVILEALQISGSGTPGNTSVVRFATGTNQVAKRCYFFSSSTNAAACAFSSAVASTIIDCDVSLTGASGGAQALLTATGAVKVIGNRVTGGPAVGISLGAGSIALFNTVYASTGIGIKTTSTSGANVIAYNTVVGGGADGINQITGTTTSNVIIGNMITDNTGDGIDMVSTANSAYTQNNRFRDNATTYNNQGDWITATSYNEVTSGAGTSDYWNSGGNDYRLIWASPALHADNPLYKSIGALEAPTPTPTATATFTPTATATATSTATATATATASFTPCAPTPTATATATPTNTPTPTSTPTNTPTPTPTAPIQTSYTFGD